MEQPSNSGPESVFERERLAASVTFGWRVRQLSSSNVIASFHEKKINHGFLSKDRTGNVDPR